MPPICTHHIGVFSLRIVNGVLSFLTVLVFWLITKNRLAKDAASKVLLLVMLLFVLSVFT